jgi:hypothetical protein
MSFQDVGKRNANRNTAKAGYQQGGGNNNNSTQGSFNYFGSLGGGDSSSSVSQISESLTQYQVCIFWYLRNELPIGELKCPYIFPFSVMLGFWKRLLSNFWEAPAIK